MMASLFRRAWQSPIKPSFLRRCLATGFGKSGDDNSIFDDDPAHASGQTIVTIMNKEQDDVLFLDAYSSMGFKLNNGLRVMGPCALFPRSVLHWNVKGVEDVNEDSLSLFTMLEPKLDILVIGVGDRTDLSKFDTGLIKYLRSKRIGVEILTTDQALATFNFLNAERRYVAGAFIPPRFIEELGDDERINSQLNSAEDPFVFKTDYHEELEETVEDLPNGTKLQPKEKK